ncbi:methyl-accepting chemotaxis protein [Bosea sp. (in: a-proteobacteria)]|uniref:methyl-accepting chemotaxis protein n=1 Tax=Bosea sp. (in: a-proteobacteria) TaxID=1871050 RepID=UPI002634F299|nr:methyl-accepting chemotaxis protein [Bosea sp. (in: a-proteobacteria)]MCO5090490.1 methyl-accepting chemotaxis protein [Bosea sp. (in: a-proteobacteria)]
MKIQIITISTLIGMAIVAWFAGTSLRSEITDGRAEKTRQLVQSTYGILEHFHSEQRAGKLTEAEAQRAAIAVIRKLRYDTSEYFWINDMEPRMIMHPGKPELDGTLIGDMADPNGKRLFIEMIDVVKRDGAGFVSYMWPKLGAEQPVGKISYVQGFAPWGWIVGSGVYTDDTTTKLMGPLMLLIGIALAAILGNAVIATSLGRHVTAPVVALSGVIGRFASGDFSGTVPATERNDEVGSIAKAVQVFKEHGLRLKELEAQERAAAAAHLARARSMEAVVGDVSEVVAAAAAGDFSARLRLAEGDEQMQRLVSGINEINAVVDGATTEFAAVLSAIAGGDLTSRVETAYRGRFADLKGAINETVDRLSETVATIQTTSADVGLAAREINTGADDLSKRTEEQASSLEETAATTEELAASVKASAQASKQAAQIADEAMQAAENGGTIAGRAVEAMARIESASQKISDIIRVIDDIAFQTNLLALNAAVEAARAGEAGKGFAVVASEVRTLAQRSGEAAKDIAGLISSSNAEVGEGVKLVRRAGEQLAHILTASQKVAATIADISAASGEQANGIDEMSQAVAHLDEMTQQNAALSEQSAASANALSGRIEQLNALVATFRTGREAPRAARPAPAATQAGEPERLRRLAEAAFAQSRAAPAPRRAANGRSQDTGWEEF